MKNYYEDFREAGGQMAVFGGEYLGCGKAYITVAPIWHDLRRDDYMPTQSKLLKKLQAEVILELNSGDRVWEALGKFEDTVFTNGSVLQLYPEESSRQGYEFPRAFFNGVEHVSGSGGSSGKVRINFVCETSEPGNDIFLRLPENSRPEMVKAVNLPDLKKLMSQLGILLAEKLDVVFDHTLCIDHFAPDPRGVYVLELEGCREWNCRSCGVFDLKLTAVFPLEKKFFIAQKLYETARFLNSCVLEFEDNCRLAGSVNKLELANEKNNGKSCTESSVRFSLTVF